MTTKLSGMGSFQAISNTSWPYGFVGAGAGGRIAIYYQTLPLLETNVLGDVLFLCLQPCWRAVQLMQPSSCGAIDCFSNVLFLPGLMAPVV